MGIQSARFACNVGHTFRCWGIRPIGPKSARISLELTAKNIAVVRFAAGLSTPFNQEQGRPAETWRMVAIPRKSNKMVGNHVFHVATLPRRFASPVRCSDT